METSIKQVQEIASVEALATALGHVVLQLFNARVNVGVALTAFVCLMGYLSSGQHRAITALACLVWVLHLGISLAIDIAKGGVRL